MSEHVNRHEPPRTNRRAVAHPRGRGSVLLLVVLVAACGEGPGSPDAGELQLTIVSGDHQVGPCYSEGLQPVVVAVADRRGVPVPRQAVDFRVVQGGGWARDETVVSDDAGFAADRWTFGAPGPQILEARTQGAEALVPVVAQFVATARDAENGRAITTDPKAQSAPAISGERIVWVDLRHGDGQLYVYDVLTATELQITTVGSSKSSPVISGHRVAWLDSRNGSWDIYLYDLTTGNEWQITTDPSNETELDLAEDRLVWTRNGHVYLHDLATATERRITAVASALSPAISGDRIVWMDFRSGWPDVYLYDLETGSEYRITARSTWKQFVTIEGNGIAWLEERAGSLDIYLHDLSTGTGRWVTTDPHYEGKPSISNDRIVWSDDRSGNLDIYLYDIGAGLEQRITTNPGDHLEPAISEDRIVWSEYRNGNQDIYLYDLTGGCVPPAR